MREVSDISHIKVYQYIFLPSFDSVIQTNTNEKRSAMSFKRLQGGRLSSFACTGEEPSFHTVTNISPFVVSRSSIHTVCDKLSERLCHLRKWLCQTSETVVQSAWHSCAKGLSQSCQRRGTSMPKAWHEQGILTKGLLSSSQAGITAWYGWQ